MTDAPIPTNIKYHRSTRLLELVYADGRRFELGAEFLRVHSPSAEVRGHGPGQEVLQVGKEHVAIERIEPVGNYAVRLYFDDGHHTGIYSWDELYRLGANREAFWNEYLDKLRRAGRQRRGET